MAIDKQALLFEFLRNSENQKTKFTKTDLVNACSWSDSTFKTYWSKGQLSPFIVEDENKSLIAINTLKLSLIEFKRKLTQSKHARELGHNFKSQLAKALLKKSKDNMTLAMEIYNRPSLENKLDAFVMCFCVAWDQLLKAEIIKNSGEGAIYEKSKNGAKTLSLRRCVHIIYPKEQSVIRKNLETIIEYRDDAVHLLLPPLQGIMSRLFQSGILNYANKFEELTEQKFIDNPNGMISLVGDFNLPPESLLNSLYGKKTASELLNIATSIEDNINKNNDIEYAIPLHVRLVYETKDAQGQIKLISASKGTEGIKNALIIEKTADREKTHPYNQTRAIVEINNLLYKKYKEEKLKNYLVYTNKKTGRLEIGTNCFQSVVSKNKWKNSNDKLHNCQKDIGTHHYSNDLIEIFVNKIMSNMDYLNKAKNQYNSNKK